MKWTVLFASVALAGCGSQSQTSGNAADALAEAQRANDRADELESKLADLESAIQQESSEREDAVNLETLNREAETSRIDSDVANLEARIPY